MRAAATVLIVLTAAPALAVASERPAIQYFFGMGLVMRAAPSEIGNLGRLTRGTYQARTLDGQQALFDHDVGLRWRAGLELGSPLFVAVDVGAGVIALPEGAQMSAPFREGSSATVLAVTGLRSQLGRSVFGVELAAGFRHLTYCIGESAEVHDYYTAYQKVAEARVRAEHRLSRSALLGATLGTSLIDPGAWVGAVDITFLPRR
jgi:hypothetical protein